MGRVEVIRVLQFGEGSRNDPLIPGVQFSASKLSDTGWGHSASSKLEISAGVEGLPPFSIQCTARAWINLEMTRNGGFLPSFFFRKKNQRRDLPGCRQQPPGNQWCLSPRGMNFGLSVFHLHILFQSTVAMVTQSHLPTQRQGAQGQTSGFSSTCAEAGDLENSNTTCTPHCLW